jgi:hypothetical protein
VLWFWSLPVCSVETARKENTMAANTLEAKAHELIGHLGAGQLAAVVHLLEVMIEDEEDELTEEDRQAIRGSRKYFRENPEGGLSFDEMVAGCGFTLDQVRNQKAD